MNVGIFIKKRAVFNFLLISIFIICFNLVFCVLASNAGSNSPQRYISYYKKMLSVGRPAAAEMKLTEGIVKFPMSVDLYIARATVRNDYLRKYDAALFDYNNAIRLGKNSHPKLYYRRGDIYAIKGMYSSAISEYTKCLNFLPGYGKVYFKRAKAYVKIGDRQRAKADLIKCMSYSPGYKKSVLRFWTENNL